MNNKIQVFVVPPSSINLDPEIDQSITHILFLHISFSWFKKTLHTGFQLRSGSFMVKDNKGNKFQLN
jgi:hypothetical protein